MGGNNVVFAPAAVSAADDITDTIETGPPHSLQDYADIALHNIFGISDATIITTINRFTESSGPIDEHLGIALVGTLAGSPTISRAVIKNLETNTVGLYKIGDTVSTATVEGIEKECVTLSSRGGLKTLCLGIETKNTVSSGLQAKHVITESRPNPVKSQESADESSDSIIESMLTNVVIEPHEVNGNVDGLKITGLDDVPAAKLLGLQDGDIIQTFNGQSVKSKQQAFQIFKKAGAGDSIDITLLRENKVKTLFFPLADRRQN